MTIRRQVLRLEHEAPIDLYVLNLTALGGPIYRFCNQVNELLQPVVWQGQTYQPYAIEGSGWQKTGQGPMPRPTVRISDIDGLAGVLVRTYQGLASVPLTRKRTLARYLDAVNFAAGNPNADPNSHFDDERWMVSRRTRDNGIAIEFELRAVIDVAGVRLPLRQINQDTCGWEYRSPECGYTGGPVATVDDAPTSNPALDECSQRLVGCRFRFGQDLPFGAFPTAGLTRV